MDDEMSPLDRLCMNAVVEYVVRPEHLELVKEFFALMEAEDREMAFVPKKKTIHNKK
ncbi:MAG: hypothetical protein WC529_01285 [Candidatus Margulisiibacteriota bacterium]